ncbi:MAG TPA: response regulator, partial [Aliidongia sp.]|nr:response regulator [Aliidongia sp.]
EQADGSITRRFGGTGLGLNICAQIVELMGGEIGMRDRQGGGSVFWIDVTLPCGKKPAARHEASLSRLNGKHALIVDDIEINRSIFVRELAEAGVRSMEAADSDEALAALDAAELEGRPFDFVLLDQMMPGRSGEELAALIRRRGTAPEPWLILVSSSGLPPRSAKGHGVRFDAVLTKPARRQQLLDCLAGLIGAAAAEPEPPPAEPEIPQHGGHVLLTEDNIINREVAATILEKHGYRVSIALDGLEAVEAARGTAAYDLILMDVQMPNLDGFGATKQIRALRGAAGRVPIVAMTANAMEGDRKRCVAAGMNDYVSKPIHPDSFLATVARWIGKSGGVPAPEAVQPDAREQPILDEQHLAGLERMLSSDRYTKLLGIYLQNAGTAMAQLSSLAASRDLASLKRLAHSLTSTSGSFGARRLQFLAERLYAACEAGDETEAGLLVPAILEASDSANDLLRTRSATTPRAGSTVH